ncbi:MAG: prolyl oligopeptidase family serine peptidase [Actinomycetota bacterium]|nr:prolyl oligopeptidase family serine peptidase [Actinomycetota bacterium]
MPLPPLIPRPVLFGNPDRISPSLSPDGRLLGYVAPEEGVLNVWVEPVDGSAPARALTHDRDRGVRSYVFCHDDRKLLYVQDNGGDESWRIYQLDLETGEARLVTPESGVQARILGHNRWNPTTVLIGLNDRDPQLHDVHRLDLATGELSLVLENPGFLSWLIDPDLRVRGGSTMDEDGGIVVYLGQDGQWEPFLTVPPDDAANTDVLGFTRDGSAVLLLSSLDANTTRLVRHDLTTGEQIVVAQDATYDVSGVWQHPETLEPQAAEFDKARQEIVLLDESLRADVDRLRALGEGEIGVGRRERTDTTWVVSLSPSDGPVHYWVYDRSTGSSRYLFPHRAELTEHTLAPMEPFSLVARDGLRLEGYATFPPGVERRDLPAVLLVHGGPWARDAWGYDPHAQWLANRGYVCVQVNFRGSTGYGKQFLNAGDKQWGAAMQDDLTDTVSHVVSQGWVDGARVGIYGGSYGGYAALAGAAFTPDVYRSAVDVVGPSNLLTLLASVPEYWKPMIAHMYRRVGNPETEKDLLRERSPLSRVDEIRIPVLVAQGANDPRVKQAEAEQIVAALRSKGLSHEYLLFEDEGHGLAKPENRERFFSVAERFLAEHLGGRAQAE